MQCFHWQTLLFKGYHRLTMYQYFIKYCSQRLYEQPPLEHQNSQFNLTTQPRAAMKFNIFHFKWKFIFKTQAWICVLWLMEVDLFVLRCLNFLGVGWRTSELILFGDKYRNHPTSIETLRKTNREEERERWEERKRASGVQPRVEREREKEKKVCQKTTAILIVELSAVIALVLPLTRPYHNSKKRYGYKWLFGLELHSSCSLFHLNTNLAVD